MSTTMGETSRVLVATTEEVFFSDDLASAPVGETLLLINEGGCLCMSALNNDTKDLFTEWLPKPKRAGKALPGQFAMRDDMHNAPTNRRILLVNQGGGFCQGILNSENMDEFIEWQMYPKRAKSRPERVQQRQSQAAKNDVNKKSVQKETAIAA